jgi:hypothetical protein
MVGSLWDRKGARRVREGCLQENHSSAPCQGTTVHELQAADCIRPLHLLELLGF